MEARRPAPSQPGRGPRPGAGSSGRCGSGPRRVSAAHSAAPAPRSERALPGPRGPGCARLHRRAGPFVWGRACCCGCCCSGCPELGTRRRPAQPSRACPVQKDKDVENGTHTYSGDPGLPLVHTHLVTKKFNVKKLGNEIKAGNSLLCSSVPLLPPILSKLSHPHTPPSRCKPKASLFLPRLYPPALLQPTLMGNF